MLLEPLGRVSHLHGILQGKMDMLGFEEQEQFQLDALTSELIASSEIEGVQLNAKSVRSSIARRFGIEQDGFIVEDRYVEGLVQVMEDAIGNREEPLTSDRIFNWHWALFPAGRSGMYTISVGEWRTGEEPMQVVSGALGRQRVHYEAPPSDSVPKMMDGLIEWCNTTQYSPFLMAAIAHLWFVTIHPLDDGNGRISRTLADMLLARIDSKGRYYSMSKEINLNKSSYYIVLERTQHGSLDITEWILWFLEHLALAIQRSLDSVSQTLAKAEYWKRFAHIEINERQRKIINRLWGDFEGKLTTSKWAKICKCSQDTALRDINDLISKNMLVAGKASGRSSSYMLSESSVHN